MNHSVHLIMKCVTIVCMSVTWAEIGYGVHSLLWWIEMWCMWICASWMWGGLLKWNLFRNCSAWRVDIVKSSSCVQCGSQPYHGYTTWWIPRIVNCPRHCYNLSNIATLISLSWILSKQKVQFDYLENVRLNSKWTGLLSHNRTEESGVDVWMQQILYCIVMLYVSVHCTLATLICYVYTDTYAVHV
jgi:hypothetical protein